MIPLIRWLVACRDAEPVEVSIALRRGIHDLVATTNLEPDGVSWAWELDGEPTAFTTRRIPASEVWPGQTWTVTATSAEGWGTAAVQVPNPPGGNVMIVIIDDVGVEKLGLYGAADAAATPTIDALAARGVVFRNAYASPTCTPTRAELLTGRHPSRNGAGYLIDTLLSTFELPLEALTIPEALVHARGAQWDSSAVGKWHLSAENSPSNHLHPMLQGFGWYAGSLGYLYPGHGYGIDGYFRWAKSQDGLVTISEVYNTTDIVDDALARIEAMPEPFLAWVAFNAPHTPFHVPPAELTVRTVTAESSAVELSAAMLEALDTELGRLLDGIDPEVLANTTIVLLADNGTSELAVTPPLEAWQAKGTVYEGGIHVPLIVAGPHVPRPGVSDALVHAVDVFATVAEIAGVPLTDEALGLAVVLPDGTRQIDGQSLLPWLADPTAPGPPMVYAESLRPNGPPPWNAHDRMVRDARWKLMGTTDGDQLFELVPGAFVDGPNLLDGELSDEQEAARLRLTLELQTRIGTMSYEGF